MFTIVRAVVLIAGVVAMNFFEPLAAALDRQGMGSFIRYPVTSFPMRYAQPRTDYHNMVGSGSGGSLAPAAPPGPSQGPQLRPAHQT